MYNELNTALGIVYPFYFKVAMSPPHTNKSKGVYRLLVLIKNLHNRQNYNTAEKIVYSAYTSLAT